MSSYEEFIDVIQSVSPESVDEDIDFENISSFDIEIDYVNNVVSVLTIEEVSNDRSHGVTDSASKSYYNDIGFKIFTIKVQGQALEDGALNQEIRVTNMISKKTVRAKVVGVGHVRIDVK